jgi:L-arabinonolactonase
VVKIEMIVDAKNNLGEGPLWDVAEQKLYWIDSLDRFIHRCDADGKNRKSWSLPADIGSMALCRDGGAVLALSNGFHAFDFETGDATLIVDPELNSARTRLNDGKVDQRGRFIAGSMDRKETEPLGTLYQLGGDRQVRVLDKEIVVSNAPCWAPDGRIFYFADSIRGEIYAYDYDVETGLASNRRLFASTKDDPGAPDGGTVDSEGYVWNAQIVGGRIVRYRPDGRVDRTIEFPVATLTSLMFGGPNLDILYVTTMGKPSVGVVDYVKAHPIPPRKSINVGDPGPGGLFAVYGLGVKGVPEPRYVG